MIIIIRLPIFIYSPLDATFSPIFIPTVSAALPHLIHITWIAEVRAETNFISKVDAILKNPEDRKFT
ncbi:hypothetical protein DdX_05172 [Ditylenchus destructor]|uniref:Uncharacterized protein n=1 Tax=Ditylenchus destructor TaxID=166010 RepID=A0AAD4NBB4_9BILA|nr:hypothetical protein DdX_05172 [Ditylenchus destructor]